MHRRRSGVPFLRIDPAVFTMSISRRSFLQVTATGAAGLSLPYWVGGRPIMSSTRATWRAGPDLPWPTQEVYCTTWKGRIVLAGGLRSPAADDRGFTTLSGTAVFDPAAAEWTVGPDLPAPRHHIVLGSADEQVFGFGGFVGDSLQNGFEFQDDVYAFDGENWTRVGAMPTPLGETVALSVDGRIHLITGSLHGSASDQRGPTGTHLVYRPDADSWDEARPAPTPRSSATGAVIDGTLYVVGGRRRETGGIQNLGTLEAYDPKADAWTERRPLPQPSGGLAGAAVDGRLYCFGGEYFSDGGGVYEQTWSYAPEEDAWTALPPMPTPRHGLAGAGLDGRIFAIGGNTAPAIAAATSTTVEVLNPTEE